MTDALGSIDMPERGRSEDDTTESQKKPRRGGKRGKKGPFARLALFYRQVIAELRKVVWPTQQQLYTYFVAVLVFVIVFMLIVAGLDLGFGKLSFWLFGGHQS